MIEILKENIPYSVKTVFVRDIHIFNCFSFQTNFSKRKKLFLISVALIKSSSYLSIYTIKGFKVYLNDASN